MRVDSYLCAAVIALGVPAAAETLNLYHRVLSQDGRSTPFALRGTVEIDNTLALTAARSNAAVYSHGQNLDETLRHFLEREAKEPDALYQLALERVHDTAEDQWPISSAKLCHLRTSTSDVLRLHVDQRTGSPYALDYFLLSAPHNGACPPRANNSVAAPLSNTTVELRLPSRVPSPILRTPPPLTAEGKPVAKEAEKSFLQKYWPYIVGFLVIQFVMGGGPAEEGEGGAQGGAPQAAK